MTDIDPEKLEEALIETGTRGRTTAEVLVWNAASAYLASLHRYKEVERECFEVVDQAGGCHGFYPSYSAAESIANLGPCRAIVRLTGTAKVRA